MWNIANIFVEPYKMLFPLKLLWQFTLMMLSSAWAHTSRVWSSFSSYSFVMLSSIVNPSRGSNTFVNGRSLLFLISVKRSFISSVNPASPLIRSFSARIYPIDFQIKARHSTSELDNLPVTDFIECYFILYKLNESPFSPCKIKSIKPWLTLELISLRILDAPLRTLSANMAIQNFLWFPSPSV